MQAVKRYDYEFSTPQQRKMIGLLRKQICLSSDIFYEILFNTYGVESSRDLTVNQANCLITEMKNKAISLGKWEIRKKSPFSKNKFSEFEERAENMATPAQLRMIDAMWSEVSYVKNDIVRAKVLNSFIKRITGKNGLRMLTKQDIQKIKKAIDTMKEGNRT